MAQYGSIPSQAVAAYYVDAKGELLVREDLSPRILENRQLGDVTPCYPLSCPAGQKLCGPVNGRYYCCPA